MLNARENGRRSLLRTRLAGALVVAVLLGGLLAAIHFRHVLTAAHDAGFSAPPRATAAIESREGARPIVSADAEFITLEPAGKFLINSITKKPVFITGDSAWSLITQLNNSDVELYVSDRASRGFNYIWVAAADNNFQSNVPNSDGDVPFDGPDFTREDAHYWEHVDYVIRRAEAHGITVALAPAFVGLSSDLGYLASYQRSSYSVLTSYGEFLGNRYKGFPNIIWAMGGDVDPSTGVVPKLSALATGIRSQDTVHLIVAEGEPQHAASDTFAGTTWMDLNWLYFHTTNIPSGAAANYLRSGSLPRFLGEGWYENEHSLNDLQLRQQGYWAVLSGAYLGNGGFGNNPLWYFNGGPHAQSGDPSWKSQLGSAGSLAQEYLGKLFRSREHWKLVPDLEHTVMTAGYDSRNFLSSATESLRSFIRRQPFRLGSTSAVAARTSDGQTIIAYLPNGNASTVVIDMNRITDSQSRAMGWWFNPRNGSNVRIGTFATSGRHKFTPPDAHDWVLVIDCLGAGLVAPGSRDL
jgi:hypothetical protein